MEEKISFQSDGLKISGLIDRPPDYKPGERRPAFIVLHGFGGNKDGQGQSVVAKQFAQWGYVTLRIDFRGCGESEGEHGRIICLDQVADTRNAISYLSTRPEVDSDKIALVGSSFGAAVAVFTGGADRRVAAVISCGGWGNGERKFRGQHPTPEAWAKFTHMLEEGKRHRERTGKSLMVPRYDIVPIPDHVRQNLEKQKVGMLAPNSVEMFPAETAQSMFDFRAEEVVGNIAPRPLLLIHAAKDSVTPTEQSVEMFKRAGQPAELHLFSGLDHFLFAEKSTRVWTMMRGWLDNYFPVVK